MISRSAYNQLVKACKFRGFAPPSDIEPKAAQEMLGIGGRMEVNSIMCPDLEICGVHFRHPIAIAEVLPVKILIGMDILRLHRATIEVHKNSIQFGARSCRLCKHNNLLNRLYDSPPIHAQREVHSLSTLLKEEQSVVESVPPRSAQQLEIDAPDDAEDEACFLVEDSSQQNCTMQTVCKVIPSVTRVSNGKLRVLIINEDYNEQQVPSDFHI
jgi:hypothetical protein